MSSALVRGLVKDFLDENSNEDVIDISAESFELRKLLAAYDLPPDAPWLGLQFIGDNEIPVSLAANNEQGLYRETGSIILHVCAEARIGVQDSLVARGEVLRDLFKGQRIGAIVVEGVTPINFGAGATLEFEGGYVSGTITVSYHADSSPT